MQNEQTLIVKVRLNPIKSIPPLLTIPL